jgi:hypothetical protein
MRGVATEAQVAHEGFQVTPEGRVKAAVKRLLLSRGVWFYMPIQNGMGVVGIPDFICCWDGRFLAIETKAPGKRSGTTPNQKARIAEIAAANGLVVVVDDVKQVEEILDGSQRP